MTAIGPGSKLVVIDTNWLQELYYGQTVPSLGQIVVVYEIVFINNVYWLKINGYFPYFHPCHFRPLDGEAEIEKLRALLNEPNNIKIPNEVGVTA